MRETIEREPEPALEPSAWVDEYADYLYGYAYVRLRNADAAEEALQRTFLSALEHLDQFSGSGTERAWLLGILKRKIADTFRERNRDALLSSDHALDAFFDAAGRWNVETGKVFRQSWDSLEKEDFWRILRHCLDALPARQSDAFVLREIEDLSPEEICKNLEVTSSNLWVLLHRARLRLAVCMRSCWK